MHKNAEVISIKEEKKEEKKEKGKEEGKSSSSEATKDKSSGESTKKKDGEATKVIEIHHDQYYTEDEIKIKDNVPYIIHYVYAPQIFSDENPNSCSIS